MDFLFYTDLNVQVDELPDKVLVLPAQHGVAFLVDEEEGGRDRQLNSSNYHRYQSNEN